MDKQYLMQKAFAVSARAAGVCTALRQKPAMRSLGGAARQFILCAVLARGTILNGFSPFAVAMQGAACARGGGFVSMLGAFFGYLVLRGDFNGVGSCAAALLTLACGYVFADVAPRRSSWFMPLVATVCMGACSFVFLPPLSPGTVLLFGCVLVMTFGASYFYLFALSPPRSAGDMLHPGGLLVLTATLLVSIYDVSLFGVITPARVIALVLVMGAAYLAGSAPGAAIGVAFGITMDAAAGHGAFFSCTYGFAALVGGVFRGAGKIGFAAAYLCAGAAAAMLGADDPVFVAGIAESAAAALVFAVIPDQLWRTAQDALLPAPQNAQEAVQRVRRGARQYATEAAQAFYEMYLGMMSGLKQGKSAADQDVRAVFDRAADKVCRRCTLCAACWEKDYVGTLSALNDVSIAMLRRGRAEAADFPGHFSARCVKFPEFLRAVNTALAALRQKQEYQARCAENRSLIAQQYAGLTGILRQMGAGLAQDITSLPAKERQVRRYAAAFGRIDCVAVYRDGNSRLRVELGGEGAARILEQSQGFTAGLAALLSVGLTPPEKICDELGSRILLREQAPFRAIVGIGQRKKPGEKVSGDTGRYFVTDDGRACLILSDGMGTGEDAAKDSKSVLSLMERFLRAGIPAQDALRTVSPAFRLGCDGTRFVTLDVLTVDLFTGHAESLKCGAAPGYLRTGGSITRLSARSLPVGLAEENEETVPLRLGHGDLYVMLTDGVTDGEQDEWLKALIETRAGDSPKELAARLVVAACERGATDDMTALVLRLEKTRV